MADYISKNEALNLIMHNDKVYHYADERYENVAYETACRISDVVAELPAADVQPVRHGRWLMHSDYPDKIICSRCDSVCDAYFCERDSMKYCPNCGARMDLGDEKT